MYRLTVLLLLISLLSFGQEPFPRQRYLTYNNELTTSKTDLNCVLNKHITKQYVQTYDCYNSRNQLVKQLNCRPRLGYRMNWPATRPYEKSTNDPSFGYLIGDMKNGKPYNGFFICEDSGFWLMFDFYLNGERIWQFYNDWLETNRVKDTETNYTILSNRNVFIKNRLQSGMAITPVKINNSEADIIQYVTNYTTTRFMLMIYAENMGDFITITPSKEGYLLESAERNSIKITYRPNGRTIAIFDKKNKLRQSVDLVQFPLEQAKGRNQTDVGDFRKGDKQYAERVANHPKPFKINRNNREEYSKILTQLAYRLYTNAPLDAAFLKDFVTTIR